MRGTRDDVFKKWAAGSPETGEPRASEVPPKRGNLEAPECPRNGGTSEPEGLRPAQESGSVSPVRVNEQSENSLSSNSQPSSSTSLVLTNRAGAAPARPAGRDEEDDVSGSSEKNFSGDLTEAEIKKAYLAVFREIEGREYLPSQRDRTQSNGDLVEAYAVVNAVDGDRLEKLARFQSAARLFLRTAYETSDEFVRKMGPHFWVLMKRDRISRYLSEAYRATRKVSPEPEYDPEAIRSPLCPDRWPSLEAWTAELEPVFDAWLKQAKQGNQPALRCALESLRRAAAHFGTEVERLPHGEVFLALAASERESASEAGMDLLERISRGGSE